MHSLTTTIQRLDIMRSSIARRMQSDRGEGVISMAIAVLVIAFLGVAMWVAFKGFANDTNSRVGDQVTKIGQ